MCSVVKKKEKTLPARIIGRIRAEASPYKHEGMVSDVPLGDVRTSGDDLAAIEARRNELRATGGQ
ncbi:MAG: hypothetical protein LBI54_00860 [Lachnospiraceae bacterium]|jgi:hypothetical protein|nr:hypothetical protein [Lachnospiraceae bacterium]